MRSDSLAKVRTGEIRRNTFGSLMEIVEYNNSGDIWVKFTEHGNIVHSSWGRFNQGKTRSVYDKTFFNAGYLGEGKYKTHENCIATRAYKTWYSMLMRCCRKEFQEKHPSYTNCVVVEEWLNFQNFAEWYNHNYYQIDGEQMNLDKDILVKGNKIYSPETCIFVPTRINNLFVKKDVNRGDLPIGVCQEKNSKKYRSYCRNSFGEFERLGYFITVKEAFNTYKSFKEKTINVVADEYKSRIPDKLYDALVNYVVEITD